MKDTKPKKTLRCKGWSYRKAAPVLGITYQYLCDVCNGVHTSIRLNDRIDEMPTYSEFLRANPNYFTRKRIPRRVVRRAANG